MLFLVGRARNMLRARSRVRAIVTLQDYPRDRRRFRNFCLAARERETAASR